MPWSLGLCSPFPMDTWHDRCEVQQASKYKIFESFMEKPKIFCIGSVTEEQTKYPNYRVF